MKKRCAKSGASAGAGAGAGMKVLFLVKTVVLKMEKCWCWNESLLPKAMQGISLTLFSPQGIRTQHEFMTHPWTDSETSD